MGVATVIMATRTTHQNDSIEIMGMTARPAPRMTAARQCESASRQKNSEQVRIFCTPKAMAAGSWVKALMRMGGQPVQQRANRLRDDDRAQNAEPRALPGAPQLARAQVLPDEGGNGRGKRGKGAGGGPPPPRAPPPPPPTCPQTKGEVLPLQLASAMTEFCKPLGRP